MGEAALDLVLAPEDQGIGIVAPAQQILGVVEPRLGEEMRAGHLAGILDADLARPIADDAGEIPQRAPESFRLGDGPAVEAGHIRLPDLPAEAGQIGRGDALGRRAPQWFGHISPSPALIRRQMK